MTAASNCISILSKFGTLNVIDNIHDLDNIVIDGANLSMASLCNFSFKNSIIKNTNFRHADLSFTNFEGANLENNEIGEY